ncbi:MAG TPA: hypothetical protein VD908_08540 [Cytophagales bacterium]|nr:hypothetical protein [Cytophagales bacterium]
MGSRNSRLFKVLWLIPIALIFSFSFSGKGVQEIVAKLKLYNKHQPQEKIYLHLDKPLYAVGEDLWFKAYLVNASDHSPDTLSKIIYVELLSPDKKLLKREVLYNKNGWANGDFTLDESLGEGNYLIRAYTNYMKNLGEDFFFIKEFTLLNPNFNSPVHAVSDQSIDLQFFPEGGNLLAGLENRIAFKAINNLGKGIDIEGVIFDESDMQITTFKSSHNGMGLVRFKPEVGKKYKAKIIRQFNAAPAYDLPEVISNGFSLGVVEEGENLRIYVRNNDNSIFEKAKSFSLVIQSRGVPFLSGEGEMNESIYSTFVPKEKFPTGIIQITLFDDNSVPQCERLFFINHKNELIVEIKTDKPSYGNRENVNLELTVKDQDGNPVSGNFSLAINDSEKIKSKEKYPSNIVNYLLLSSDLKGLIEEPGYYFKDTLKETRDKLDLLMMTNGWRRFSWNVILSDSLPPIHNFPEKGIPISGQVFRRGKPAGESQVKIAAPGSDVIMMRTDPQGKFYLDKFMFNDSSEVFIQTYSQNGAESPYKLTLNPLGPSPELNYNPAIKLNNEASTEFLEQNEKRKKTLKIYKTILLKEIVVEGKKEKGKEPFRYYTPDKTIRLADMNLSSDNVFDYIQPHLRNHMFLGSFGNDRFPLVILDGVEIEYSELKNPLFLHAREIEIVDIIKFSNAAAFGARGFNGVIVLHSKKGHVSTGLSGLGVNKVKHAGIYLAREFYSPNYSVASEANQIVDIRNTLFWKPAIITDNNGKASVSFYTSDISSKYEIVIEGISDSGLPGRQTKEIEVSNKE